MLTIEAKARSRAPRESVWELLSDVATWPRWAEFDETALESAPGKGEIRRFHRGKRVTREKVIAMEAPSRLSYELVSGIPINGYVAEVTLESTADGGTDISWRSRFNAKIPGTGRLIQRQLSAFIEQTARGLASYAEEMSSSDSTPA